MSNIKTDLHITWLSECSQKCFLLRSLFCDNPNCTELGICISDHDCTFRIELVYFNMVDLKRKKTLFYFLNEKGGIFLVAFYNHP